MININKEAVKYLKRAKVLPTAFADFFARCVEESNSTEFNFQEFLEVVSSDEFYQASEIYFFYMPGATIDYGDVFDGKVSIYTEIFDDQEHVEYIWLDDFVELVKIATKFYNTHVKKIEEIGDAFTKLDSILSKYAAYLVTKPN